VILANLLPKPKGIPPNRYSDSHLTKEQQVAKFYECSKEDWLRLFRRVMKWKHKYLNTNNLKNYLNISDILANSLLHHLKDLKEKRNKYAQKAKQKNKLSKKNEVRKLLNRGYGVTRISKELSISRTWVYKLKNEIEDETAIRDIVNAIDSIKARISKYNTTKFLLRNFGYNAINPKDWGNYKFVKSAINKLSVTNISEFLDVSINFNVNSLHYYQSGNMGLYIDQEIDSLDFNWDLSSEDFWEKAQNDVKWIIKLMDELEIMKLIEKEMKRWI
jgi:hypothetical protein